MLTRLSTMAPRNAGRNPSIRNPGTSAAAISSISALITSQNKPSVTMLRGNVTIFRKKPIVPLTSPITMAAISAAPNPLIRNPLITCATITRLNALSSQLISKCPMPQSCASPACSSRRNRPDFAHQREQIPVQVPEECHPQLVIRHLGDQVRLAFEADAARGESLECPLNIRDLVVD